MFLRSDPRLNLKKNALANMDGNLLAKRIALHAVSEKATKLTV